MTKRELEKILTQSGWVITHGKGHDMATNPQMPGVKIPIPRHSGDIPKGTAKSILKDAGLE
ncbi:type II toxin-antitoxin system HicA family toxin [Treponema sp. TIM-1]|uniref:type II toxin-antitoxin system HicA family toxin n=1 Tax=Treponema sp. TIM-1 TaxID=2898417 RepID=UPI00397F07C6